MIFESRCFWHPKDLGYERDYEDAFAVATQGVAAIADGVSSAIFSRRWADILTRRVVEDQPDLSVSGQLTDWLSEPRKAWAESIDSANLNYFQASKLEEVGGAYTTLLWVKFSPEPTDAPSECVKFRFVSRAIGDCCLFHIREGGVLDKFPLQHSDEFAADPITICSTNRGVDGKLTFQSFEGVCQSDDFIVLASDAIAGWIYQQIECDGLIEWVDFWNMTPATWTETVSQLRALEGDQRMRVDDTTLVMLRMARREEFDAEDDVRGPLAPVVIGVAEDSCAADAEAAAVDEIVDPVDSPSDPPRVPDDSISEALAADHDAEVTNLADDADQDSPLDPAADESFDESIVLIPMEPALSPKAVAGVDPTESGKMRAVENKGLVDGDESGREHPTNESEEDSTEPGNGRS